MSVLSANTLFHFTHTLETLLLILEQGFRPSYCSEFGPVTEGRIKESYIPMVCFCDLPLSRIEKHSIGSKWKYKNLEYSSPGYGRFALGMSKEWGQDTKLNPVTYITNKSFYLDHALALNAQSNALVNNMEDWKALGRFSVESFPMFQSGQDILDKVNAIFYRISNIREAAHSLFNYIKPYRNIQTGQLYYDEREWRYVVPFNEMSHSGVPPLMPSVVKDIDGEMKKYKDIIHGTIRLPFEPKDIKYIIVDKDDDVKVVVDKMKCLPGKYRDEDIKRLTSRILTSEQIHEDF